MQFSLKKTQGATNQVETKIFVGKVFLNISDSELLFALSAKQPPRLEEDELLEMQEETTLVKVKTGLQFDGLEFDFKFGAKGL